MHPRQQLEEVFHYVAPVVILLYYLVAATITVCTLQTARSEDERAPRKSILSVMLVVMLTYVSINNLHIPTTSSLSPC